MLCIWVWFPPRIRSLFVLYEVVYLARFSKLDISSGWLTLPFNSAKISLYSCSSVGRSPQESSRHRYVWTRLRCYSLVPRKFKKKSCDSAASNRLKTNDVLVQMFTVSNGSHSFSRHHHNTPKSQIFYLRHSSFRIWCLRVKWIDWDAGPRISGAGRFFFIDVLPLHTDVSNKKISWNLFISASTLLSELVYYSRGLALTGVGENSFLSLASSRYVYSPSRIMSPSFQPASYTYPSLWWSFLCALVANDAHTLVIPVLDGRAPRLPVPKTAR
jgi:hypothetical protein